MSGPNVLVLDEPTNDFDVETLTALEDLLDGFAGTLIVISHDRYFLERACDDFYALLGDGRFTHLTGGVEEYLERVRSQAVVKPVAVDAPPKVTAKQQRQDQRTLTKEMTKIERAIAKVDDTERSLHEQMAEAATDHSRLADLNRELRETQIRKAELEDEWMRLAAELEG
jgi:ATP-binding cassette subfamily F protein uup